MLGRLTNHPVVPQVLIWALLLCHGAFGALHGIAEPGLADTAPAALSTGEHATAHHASGHHDPTGHEKRQADHAATEYFAVLLGTFFGGLALWSLLRKALRLDDAPSVMRRPVGKTTAVFAFPRGPTLTRLQVFRL